MDAGRTCGSHGHMPMGSVAKEEGDMCSKHLALVVLLVGYFILEPGTFRGTQLIGRDMLTVLQLTF